VADDERVRVRGGDPMITDAESGARNVRRPALTFKVRRRGLSVKRQAEFDEWLPTWSIAMTGPLLDWADVFPPADGGTRDPARGVVLDIGYGHGESTIAMAHAEPELDVIGVEVHDPGVVTVLDAIVNDPLPHVRVVHGDAVVFLDRIPPASLRTVRIFFPDPWKKQRQHHRRLVRSDIVSALVRRGIGTALAYIDHEGEVVCHPGPTEAVEGKGLIVLVKSSETPEVEVLMEALENYRGFIARWREVHGNAEEQRHAEDAS
jgi:tRNA G46 methylase TrmB